MVEHRRRIAQILSQRQDHVSVLQPSFAVVIPKVGPGQLALAWWGNLNLTDGGPRANEDRFTEYDWTIGYGISLNDSTVLELGLIYYYFPNDGIDNADSDTSEIYGKLSMAFTQGLGAVVTGYYDTDEAGLEEAFHRSVQVANLKE